MTSVFIVDDSAVARETLAGLLRGEHGIEVIGTAPDPVFAMSKMERAWPDVLITDVEMPRMDGITFIKQVMSKRPTPTIVCSSLTASGTQVSLDALAAGALTVFEKPSGGLAHLLADSRRRLVEAVRTAGTAKVGRLLAPIEKVSADAVLPAPSSRRVVERTTDTIIAIGTSTGGTQALDFLARSLPPDVPGLVIVQHMPEAFTRAFADRLNQVSALDITEARGGERIGRGRALIAPGGKHMVVKRSGAQYFTEIVDGPRVNRHRPSVDVLFRSVARAAGPNALGIIMTGMGDDGARGLREMLDVGAHTVAQDEKSSIVYGMPKEAVGRGAVEVSLDLRKIPDAIARYAHV